MQIVIVGLGVIGGSFAFGLKEAGYDNVYGIDINEDSLSLAKEKGVIKDGFTNGSDILKSSDIIILSIYPKLVKNFIKDNINNFKKGAIITDATGIKTPFIKEIEEILPEGVDFVFGHPMAGREKKGFEFATNEVFKGANYIITPIEKNKTESLDLIEKLALSLGFKKVKRISPEYHDEMIGFTSQLPHALAVALINSDEEGRDTGSFIGDSYRDLTRIANINGDLWSELFLGNKENLLKAMDDFESEFLKIRQAIEQNNKEDLIEIFKKSTERREKL
ncbi:MAG: prephenate dehydrogenase [Clostridium sp.]